MGRLPSQAAWPQDDSTVDKMPRGAAATLTLFREIVAYDEWAGRVRAGIAVRAERQTAQAGELTPTWH